MSVKLYPFDLPAGVHPLAWTLLGFGLDAKTLDVVARHLFDDVGVRLHDVPEPETVELAWAVDYPLDPGERTVVSVGDPVDELVPGGDRSAVRVTGGALPPGVRLEKHSGRLVGAYTTAGLYSVTVTIFPTVKYDPLGGPGGPDSVGKWIPIDQPRFIPDAAPAPETTTLADMSDEDLENLIVAARQAQAAKIIHAADAGGA